MRFAHTLHAFAHLVLLDTLPEVAHALLRVLAIVVRSVELHIQNVRLDQLLVFADHLNEYHLAGIAIAFQNRTKTHDQNPIFGKNEVSCF